MTRFENEFANYVGTRFAIAVSSGTAGLMVGMMALDLEPGDHVLTTPLTHISTSNAAMFAGGIPVFTDVDRSTLCLSPHEAIRNLDRRTRAVIGVDLYGLPFDVEAFEDVRSRKGIAVVEDAAQALGAARHGRRTGAFGDLAVFSFYSTKHIGLGEGGMITTNDSELATRSRMISSHGQSRTYFHTMLGYNFRLSQTAAETGLKQLRGIDKELKRRKQLAKVYREQLEDKEGLTLQRVGHEVEHSYYKFPIIVEGLTKNMIDAAARQVSSRVSSDIGRGYGRLSYQQPLYREIRRLFWGAKVIPFPDYSTIKLPVAEDVVKRIVELPTNRAVDEDKAAEISECLVREYRKTLAH